MIALPDFLRLRTVGDAHDRLLAGSLHRGQVAAGNKEVLQNEFIPRGFVHGQQCRQRRLIRSIFLSLQGCESW